MECSFSSYRCLRIFRFYCTQAVKTCFESVYNNQYSLSRFCILRFYIVQHCINRLNTIKLLQRIIMLYD